MSDKVSIRSPHKDVKNFKELPDLRRGVINEAPATAVQGNFAVNSTANFLHPATQHLKVKQVAEIAPNVRAYVLESDAFPGTAKLAFFRAGQSISLTLNIGNITVTRPYTICSSPARSTEDEYVIIVKSKPNGFASKFIYNTWKKGTEVIASAPFGNFYFNPLRDNKNIIGICDNEGVSAFLSLAEAICDGTVNAKLTLFYAARKQREAVMQERFDELAEGSMNFNVIYVLSDEHILGKERGFITKTMIEKYAPAKYSLFINGSQNLYKMTLPQVSELRLQNKSIRMGLGGQIENPAKIQDFPKDAIGLTFLCKVIRNGEAIATVPCASEESLLVSLEKEGVTSPALCRSGECGFCRSRLLQGNVFIPQDTDSRRLADSSYGIIHPCMSYPMSNLTLEIN